MALEVAAAVVGLLAAAGKVGETLTPVVVSFTTAPQQIHSLCTEVSNTRLILFGLQRLFEELDDTSSYRKRFIQVQQLIAVLTDGVLLFGELEKLAYYLKSQPSTVYSRIQWIRKGKLVEGLLRRLLIFKTTMQLMLNIVQCESDEDARHDRQALVSITADLLKNNLDLGRRVADLEHSSDDDCSTRWSFSIHSTGTVLHRMEDVRINRSERISQSRFTRTNMFQFDADLQASHVYRKVMRDTVDYSFRSSIGLSHAWTTLSKLTLSDISHLSVVGLPLYPNEVSNAYHYKTWSTTDDQSTSERQCLYTELLSNDPTDVVNDPTTTDLRSLDVRKPEHTDLVASNDEENQRCQRMYIVIIPGREEVESKTRLEDYAYPSKDHDRTMGSHVSHRMFLTVDGTEVELTTDAVDVACAFRLFENHDLLLDTRCIDGDAFLLSYESSSRASFKRICHYQRIIRQYIQRDSVPVIIVARDFSSTRKREVSHAEGWALASKEKCIFYVLNMEDASPKVTNEVLVRFIRARWHWDARNSIPRSENNAVQGL